eukprot:g5452.t1
MCEMSTRTSNFSVLLVAAGACCGAASPSFNFVVDWSSGGANTSFPTTKFGVRKVEAFVYPLDGTTYAYADVVNYSDPHYPDSYSSEIGVFSSADGKTGWQYHGIVVPRGQPGEWDGGGVASPGAAAVAGGSVLVAYAAEKDPTGGINRGIGVSRAPHPLGPFVKMGRDRAIASPDGVCGGSGRCDDVIMQSRADGVHLYHSVKGSNVAPGNGIRHRMTTDGGDTWSNSTLVLSTTLQPGTNPAESIAGKYFPRLAGGAMVLVCDGGPNHSLHAYVSERPGSMTAFVPAAEPSIATHPRSGSPSAAGAWANLQIAFLPSAGDGHVASVGYTVWEANTVPGAKAPSAGMTMTVYDMKLNVTQ